MYGVPKGLYAPGEEDAIKCARREFAEETGGEAPREDALAKLGSFRTSSSKSVHVWVCEQGKMPTTTTLYISWKLRPRRTVAFEELEMDLNERKDFVLRPRFGLLSFL